MFLPKLSSHQLDRLSDIYAQIGTVSLASIAIPSLLDKFNLLIVVLGLSVAVLCWFISIYIRR